MAGVINTSQSFANGDSVTSTKLNAITTGSSFTSDAVSGTGLAVTSGGLLTLGTVSSSNMGTNSVLTASIGDAQVTSAKISSGGPAWNASSSTLGSGVTGTYTVNFSPARTGDGDTVFNIGSQTSTSTNSTITRKSGVNGALDFVQTGTGAMTFTSTSGGFKFGDAPMPTPSGTAPIFGARAAVDFNADAAIGGNCTIRKALNVTSVKKTAVGRFEITITNALPSSYICLVNCGVDAGSALGLINRTDSTTTTVVIRTGNISAYGDYTTNNVVIFA